MKLIANIDQILYICG